MDADPPSSINLNALLKDLAERARLAEARAEAAEQAARAERLRAQAAETRAEVAETQNQQLSEQVAFQEKFIEALMNRIASLTRRLAEARSRPEQLALELELAAVQRRLDELNHDKFGQSSERRGRPDGAAGPSGAGGKDRPEKKKKSRHGPRPQPRLPRDPQLYLLDEADQVCPRCIPLRPLKPCPGRTIDSEEVTVVERTFRVNLHQQQVYRCGGCGHTEVALGPERFIPGGRYSVEFAATVAVDKYRDHLPLDRQARRMGEQGLDIDSQTLWDQIAALYVLLLPSYLALQARILQSEVVHADETHWRVMRKGGSKRWWVWALTDGKRVFFLLAPTRGQAAARQLLLDYAGIVMADRYVVYETLEKARTRTGGPQLMLIEVDGKETSKELPTPDYLLVACWMHARRGFIKAARQGEAQAVQALELIARLYAIEARATAEAEKEADDGRREKALLVARKRLRAAESRPVIEQLGAWMKAVEPMPGLLLEAAVTWLDNGWPQLVRFLDDPRIPLDNGEAERAVRGPVVGRKVHAGSRSEKGTQVAALYYSVVESCRLEGVDARAYLIEAGRRAQADRTSVFLPEDYARLLAEQAAAEKVPE